jgi:large subunit ribosomal protein L27
MATKKAGGSTRNGRDSKPKYLGVKCYGEQWVRAGDIIVRQRGTKVHAGLGAGCGRDHTIYAMRDGRVVFVRKGPKKRQYVQIMPDSPQEAAA